MIHNLSGRTYVAYETNVGDLLVIRYLTRYNRYYTYRCELRGNRINWATCERVDTFYVCGIIRVKYCVNTTTTSNVYVEVTVCTDATEDDLNRVLSGCPRRNAITIPWDYLRRRTRRAVLAECRNWWMTDGIADVDNYLTSEAARMLDSARNWVAYCYNPSTNPELTFLDLLSDYVTEGEFIAWTDETRLMHARCTPEGRLINVRRVNRFMRCV